MATLDNAFQFCESECDVECEGPSRGNGPSSYKYVRLGFEIVKVTYNTDHPFSPINGRDSSGGSLYPVGKWEAVW